MKNVLAILIFNDFTGDRHVIRQPTANIVNYVEKIYPNAILKMYDFETCEIITLVSDDFKFIEHSYEVNHALCNFMHTMRKSRIETYNQPQMSA